MNNGGPAFPAPSFGIPGDLAGDKVFLLAALQGMSLRDWFAGMAMQGLLRTLHQDKPADECFCGHITTSAYQIADAMLAAREDVQ